MTKTIITMWLYLQNCRNKCNMAGIQEEGSVSAEQVVITVFLIAMAVTVGWLMFGYVTHLAGSVFGGNNSPNLPPVNG